MLIKTFVMLNLKYISVGLIQLQLFQLTCILTAMITELSSGPRDLLRANRVNVKLHNLKRNQGISILQRYRKFFCETKF